jgi:hypothetical protein
MPPRSDFPERRAGMNSFDASLNTRFDLACGLPLVDQ